MASAFMCNWPSTFKMFSFIFYGASNMKVVVVLIPKLVVGSKSSLWRVSELFLCEGSSCKVSHQITTLFLSDFSKVSETKGGFENGMPILPGSHFQ